MNQPKFGNIDAFKNESLIKIYLELAQTMIYHLRIETDLGKRKYIYNEILCVIGFLDDIN